MGRTRIVSDLEDTDLDLLPAPSLDEFEVTPEQHQNLQDLLQDPSLTIEHPVYVPIHDKLKFYLESGYKDHEIRGEFGLTNDQFANLQAHTSLTWWEKHRIASNKWVARKRGYALRNKTPNDFAVLQSQDPSFSTKQVNLNLEASDTALTAEEKLKIAQLFPSSPPKIIDVTPTPNEKA
jgi:hypothetical protein